MCEAASGRHGEPIKGASFFQCRQRQNIETLKQYNQFFLFTSHAYLVGYVIYMAGVFDKGKEKMEDKKQTISLPPLVREMKATQQLSGQDAAEADVLLAKADCPSVRS